jgi:hypothetical protein
MEQFNSSQINARDQFNAQNALVIAQANAQLQAQISLADTAGINAANQFNAQSALGVSSTTYNAQVQVMRDNVQYAWQTGENALTREMELAKTNIASEASRYAADRTVDAAMYEALGTMSSQLLTAGSDPNTIVGALKGALTSGTKAVLGFLSGGAESEGYTLVPNYATSGDEGFGWNYYTDSSNNSVVISPNKEYYYNGELVWTPPSSTSDYTFEDYSGGYSPF